MSASNTVSIQLVLQGSPEIVNQIKTVLTGFNQLKVGLDGAKQSMSGGFRLDGLQGLQAAMGSAEQQTNKFRSTLSKIGGEISKNGSAFSVAAASVWGVYNAYDSLTKVQIRASQSITRVSSLTTTLATLENRLTEARQQGNLSAEEMAILEQRITDTKTKLAVAQERSADLQGDVNEAWGQFASQVGPQAIAAAGSIGQVVTSMRGSLTGLIPKITQFFGGMTSLAGSSAAAATSARPLGSIFASTGTGAQIGATGIRAMSGAMKALLIGSGIGAILVAVGLLTEGFGLLGKASAESANDLSASQTTTVENTGKYSDAFQAAYDRASTAIEEHAKNVKTQHDAMSATIRTATLNDARFAMENTRKEWMAAKAKSDAMLVEINKLREQYKDAGQFSDIYLFAIQKMIPAQMELAGKTETLRVGLQAEGKALGTLVTIFKEQETAAKNSIAMHSQSAASSLQNALAIEKTHDAVRKAVDLYVSELVPAVKAGTVSEEAFIAAFENSAASYTNNTELKGVATEHFNAKVKELFPDMEKLAKAEEKEVKNANELIAKWEELEIKFGVEVPESIKTSETALEAYGKVLENNKQLIDEWLSHAEEFKNFSSASKALKLEFEVDKEVKDFIKDFDKETEKKIKIVVKREQAMQDFKALFESIQSIFFKQGKGKLNADGTTTFDMEFRPIYNESDAIEFRDTLLDSLDNVFKGAKKPEYIKTMIEKLSDADSKAEIIKVLQEYGFLLEQTITENASTAAENAAAAYDTAFKSKLGPLGSILTTGTSPGQKGKVTSIDPETGKQTIEPVGKGETSGQVADQTALQVALQKTQESFANLATQGANSMAMLAKASSAAINGIKNNLKVGEVASQKLQTGLANLSNEGLKSLAAIAKSSSAAMNGTKGNLSVGEVAAQKLQKGLANLAIQGSNSLRMLAQTSSSQMNGFVNNLKKGETAARRLQSAIDDLESKSITVTTTYVTKRVNAQHGFHGVISTPTNFTVGEGSKPELVTVTPLTGGSTPNPHENIHVQSASRLVTNERRQQSQRSGPTTIHLTSYIQAVPGSNEYRKVVQEFSLDDLSRFSTS